MPPGPLNGTLAGGLGIGTSISQNQFNIGLYDDTAVPNKPSIRTVYTVEFMLVVRSKDADEKMLTETVYREMTIRGSDKTKFDLVNDVCNAVAADFKLRGFDVQYVHCVSGMSKIEFNEQNEVSSTNVRFL
jgi:hypothetical protein